MSLSAFVFLSVSLITGTAWSGEYYTAPDILYSIEEAPMKIRGLQIIGGKEGGKPETAWVKLHHSEWKNIRPILENELVRFENKSTGELSAPRSQIVTAPDDGLLLRLRKQTIRLFDRSDKSPAARIALEEGTALHYFQDTKTGTQGFHLVEQAGFESKPFQSTLAWRGKEKFPLYFTQYLAQAADAEPRQRVEFIRERPFVRAPFPAPYKVRFVTPAGKMALEPALSGGMITAIEITAQELLPFGRTRRYPAFPTGQFGRAAAAMARLLRI